MFVNEFKLIRRLDFYKKRIAQYEKDSVSYDYFFNRIAVLEDILDGEYSDEYRASDIKKLEDLFMTKKENIILGIDYDYKAMVEDGIIVNGKDGFQGEYSFLSNFHTHKPIEIKLPWGSENAKIYTAISVEHAFQAAKFMNEKHIYDTITQPTPSLAKRCGRHYKLRKDWESIKFDVIYYCVFKKFIGDHDLYLDLINKTCGKHIVEFNWWNDQTWGVSNKSYVGKNMLGEILMNIRDSSTSGHNISVDKYIKK